MHHALRGAVWLAFAAPGLAASLWAQEIRYLDLRANDLLWDEERGVL